jgi:hypothetical protein
MNVFAADLARQQHDILTSVSESEDLSITPE